MRRGLEHRSTWGFERVKEFESRARSNQLVPTAPIPWDPRSSTITITITVTITITITTMIIIILIIIPWDPLNSL